MISPDAALEIIARLSPVENIVLIGGQALRFWCEQYASKDPALEGMGPFASKDVDYQGARHAVSRCATLLNGREFLPSLDDATWQTGKIVFSDNTGTQQEIDFLNSPFGLPSSAVLERAVVVTYGSDVRVRVMHPYHCLVSRVQNVVHLANNYANPHGFNQLRAAVRCIWVITEELARSGRSREALKLVRRVANFAKGRDARALHRRYGIDVFDAVPCTASMPESFRATNYPQMKEYLSWRRSPSRRKARRQSV